MPVKAVKKGEVYRVVEPDGSIAKTSDGKAVDGGGHRSKDKAERQARAINANTQEE